MNYWDIIRSVREDRDDTQARIGEVLHKSQQGYSHIESGRAELKIDDLIKLCKFYNLSADYLIGLTSTLRSYKGIEHGVSPFTDKGRGVSPALSCIIRFCRCRPPAYRRPSAGPALPRPTAGPRGPRPFCG